VELQKTHNKLNQQAITATAQNEGGTGTKAIAQRLDIAVSFIKVSN